MEKVITKRYRRRNGIVVSETITETHKFDKYDRKHDRDQFNIGIALACIAISMAVTALAVLFVKVLF